MGWLRHKTHKRRPKIIQQALATPAAERKRQPAEWWKERGRWLRHGAGHAAISILLSFCCALLCFNKF